jgi:transposase
MGAFYRRMKARLGAPQAITAAAHRLARVIYALLREGASYVDLGQEAYEQQFQKRRLRNLQRLAHRMGLLLIPAPSPSPG